MGKFVCLVKKFGNGDVGDDLIFYPTAVFSKLSIIS